MPRPGEPDYYRSRARAEGYVARAVYKLKEVDEKYHLIKPGQRVLDLGCSPGSWLQYIASRTGPGGLVVGVDATPPAIELVPPLYFVHGEVTSLDLETIIAISPIFDVVVSDLAPKTTGMRAGGPATVPGTGLAGLGVGPAAAPGRRPFPGQGL